MPFSTISHVIASSATNPAANGHSSYRLLTPALGQIKVFAGKSSPPSRPQSALRHHMCQYVDYDKS